MSDLQPWQLVATAAVAIGSVVPMCVAIAKMFARRSAEPGVVRQATEFESALAQGLFPYGAVAFDGFSYRVAPRFAGKVRVVVAGDRVVVAGPRVGRGLYIAWIWTQGVLLALVLPTLALAVLTLDGRVFVAAFGFWLASWGISCVGAGMLPGIGEFAFMGSGRHVAVEFPVSSARDVKIGRGWSDGGIDMVLLPYRVVIDQMARGHAVSWYAPDGTGHEVRYAIHLADAEAASALAGVLRGGRTGD